MDNALVFSTTLTADECNTNLLALLIERFPYHSEKDWQKNIFAGKIALNGETVYLDIKLTAGDTLSYTPDSFNEPIVPKGLEKIMSSQDFLVLGKSAGTPVSRTGIIVSNTFINLVRREFGNPDIHLMHRLDRETSGIVLCASNRDICQKHQKNLRDILRGKYYLAIVRGKLNVGMKKIKLPLGTAKHNPIRCKVAVDPDGKPCETIIHSVSATDDTSLVLVQLITGRKHQIRCHLAHIGHPIIGDKIYDHDGKYYLKRLEQDLCEEDYHKLGAKNHTLHAWAAKIKLPGKEQKMYFSKCFSDDFLRCAESFPDWQNSIQEKLHRLIHP